MAWYIMYYINTRLVRHLIHIYRLYLDSNSAVTDCRVSKNMASPYFHENIFAHYVIMACKNVQFFCYFCKFFRRKLYLFQFLYQILSLLFTKIPETQYCQKRIFKVTKFRIPKISKNKNLRVQKWKNFFHFP